MRAHTLIALKTINTSKQASYHKKASRMSKSRFNKSRNTRDQSRFLINSRLLVYEYQSNVMSYYSS